MIYASNAFADHLVVVVVVVVAFFSSLARILEACSTIHSPPALFVCVYGSGDQLALTNSTLCARISPQ